MEVHNADIATVFEEIADLLEIKGDNPFRIIHAYRGAAHTLATVGPDIQKMVRQGRDLTELPGIRTDLAIRKVGIATTGSCTCLTICDIACRQRSSSSVAYRVWARSGSVFFTRNAAHTVGGATVPGGASSAKGEGLLFSIHSDAHSVLQFGELAYGIGRGRRGWLEKGDVLNTRTVQHLGRFWGKHLPEAAR